MGGGGRRFVFQMETAAALELQAASLRSCARRDFSEITLDPISLHAWLALMETWLKKRSLLVS